MSQEIVTALDKIDAPWGKEIELHRVEYESGLTMLRMRIREGRRFTIIDLDADTARRLAGVLGDFARQGS